MSDITTTNTALFNEHSFAQLLHSGLVPQKETSGYNWSKFCPSIAQPAVS